MHGDGHFIPEVSKWREAHTGYMGNPIAMAIRRIALLEIRTSLTIRFGPRRVNLKLRILSAYREAHRYCLHYDYSYHSSQIRMASFKSQ